MILSSSSVITELTNLFLSWVGYCEKNSSSVLGTDLDNPESFTANAGDGNYTIFAKVYKEWSGINVQGQPWCDTFVDSLFIYKFGVDMAKKLLGGFSAYTPTSANYFKNMNQWYTSPQEGDIIFFKNSTRIYHTGYVRSVSGNYVYTVEGNTSSSSVVDNEGGCVAKKYYLLTNSAIAGYGRPDYSLVSPTYTEGWVRAADGVRWWYQYSDGSYPANAWLKVDGHWYLFDEEGYMMTGLVEKDGKYYALNPATDSTEGALMVTADATEGNLVVGTF